MSRHFLSEWSQALSAAEFAEALYVLGIAEDGTKERLRWSPASRDAPAKSASDFLASGSAKLAQRGNHNLLISANAPLEFVERCDFARTLASLDAIESVTIECNDRWAQSTPWRLPLSIGVLESDPAKSGLLERNRWFPPNWPFQFHVASALRDRHQILVSSRGARTTLAALADAPATLKANALIVNGLDDGETNAGMNTLWRLASRLSAAGVAFATTAVPDSEFEGAVVAVAHQLAHDLPFDAALDRVFGDKVLLYGNESLLRESKIRRQVTATAARMDRMPKSSTLEVGARSVEMLARHRDVRAAVLPKAMPTGEPALVVPAEELREAMASAAPEFAFSGESHEASALTELSDALRSSAAGAVRPANERRFIQQQCFTCFNGEAGEPLRKAFLRDSPVRVNVRIGAAAAEGWQSSTQVFPDHELPANETSHRLRVVFYAPGHVDEPKFADISLPQTGASSIAAFDFTPSALGAFEGRISVLHRGRVLQTALLRANVVAAQAEIVDAMMIELVDETQVRHDWTNLDRRQRFDLAFVCNHDTTETARVTGVSEDHAWATDLQGIETAVQQINAALSSVTNNIDDYADGLDQGENPALLIKLAQAGRQLYTRLVHAQLRINQEGDFDLLNKAITHIQVIDTRLDALVPLEFVYDYALPPLGVPTLCPEHKTALEAGACKETCPGQTTNKHVCPMGFWGVRKVIERHAFDAARVKPGQASLVVQSEVTALRERIDVREGAVIGHSERVKADDIKPLFDFVKGNSNGEVVLSSAWEDWASAVTANSPEFLIAFPHSARKDGDRALEIGGGTPLVSGNLDHFADIESGASPNTEWFVRTRTGDAPLVLLLGCDTMSAAENYGSHVFAFRQAGAAAVIATVATVAATHAVRVGAVLTEEIMRRAAEADDEALPTRKFVGEALRDAKRKALAESLPMALAVVGYGDADWRI
jgi:hypothetical protein